MELLEICSLICAEAPTPWPVTGGVRTGFQQRRPGLVAAGGIWLGTERQHVGWVLQPDDPEAVDALLDRVLLVEVSELAWVGAAARQAVKGLSPELAAGRGAHALVHYPATTCNFAVRRRRSRASAVRIR
jgi:hypothetical protein